MEGIQTRNPGAEVPFFLASHPTQGSRAGRCFTLCLCNLQLCSGEENAYTYEQTVRGMALTCSICTSCFPRASSGCRSPQEGKFPPRRWFGREKGNMALEKGVPCVPALCQSWTRLVGKKPQERGNLECCCGQVGVLLGLCSGVFWLQGGRSHEKLGE